MLRRQGLGLVPGLTAGVQQQHVPATAGGATTADWFGRTEHARLLGACRHLLRPALLPALLRLQYEAAALVEVDAAVRGAAVRLAEGDGALEDIVVAVAVGGGGLGARDAEQVAQVGEEESVVRTFGAADAAGPEGGEGRSTGQGWGKRRGGGVGKEVVVGGN